MADRARVARDPPSAKGAARAGASAAASSRAAVGGAGTPERLATSRVVDPPSARDASRTDASESARDDRDGPPTKKVRIVVICEPNGRMAHFTVWEAPS